MACGLRGDDPSRCDRPFIAQCVIAPAEILTAEVGARIAVERVVVVVDRAGVGARILQKGSDERLARAEVIGDLCGSEVAAALRCDELPCARS